MIKEITVKQQREMSLQVSQYLLYQTDFLFAILFYVWLCEMLWSTVCVSVFVNVYK